MKQYYRHLEIARRYMELGDREGAVRYINGLIRSAMSNRAAAYLERQKDIILTEADA